MSRQPSNLSDDPFREISSVIHNRDQVPPPNPPVPVDHPVAKNVTVEVSGSSFCIIPSLFKHIEQLNWKRNGETLRLNADPDVFEMILQYFMFSSLPDFNALSHRKATELLQLISPLEPVATQQLVQYVEHYLVTNPTTKSSSFLRKRLHSFSSMSSRNKASTSHQPGSTQNKAGNEVGSSRSERQSRGETVVPSHIRSNNHHQQTHPPPFHQVDVRQQAFGSNKSQSSFPTSVVRSDSCSSDGSISKLSQPSSYMGGRHDENCIYQPFDVLEQQHPPVAEAHAISIFHSNNNNMTQPSYQSRVEKFNYVGTFPKTLTPKILSETTCNNISQAKEEPQVLGESKKDQSTSNNTTTLAKKEKGSKKLFRNVFRSNKGDRGQRKMTHADWCSSEYVL